MTARFPLLAAALALAGCSNSVGPDDDMDPDATSYYEVQVILWRIDVIGDCDANVAFGLPNQGEFQYRVDVIYEDHEGREVDDRWVVASSLYGNPKEGESLKRNSGETIEFSAEHGNDVESIFTTREDAPYEIHFYAIEWDGNDEGDEDDRLAPPAVRRGTVGEDGYQLSLGLGSGDECRLSLRGLVKHLESDAPEAV